MNPRTLIITASTIVALAAPAAAGAKILPTTHAAKHARIVKHTNGATHVATRQGHALQRYIDVTVSTNPTPLSPSELCDQQNEDLIAHALEPIDCSAAEAQTATSDTSVAAADQPTQTDPSTTTTASDRAVSQDTAATDDTTLSDPDWDC